MARKKSQSIQRKGRGTPNLTLNPERPPSTWTESFHSISPLIDGTTRMMIDEPKDWIIHASNETSRPVTPQDTNCRRRLTLNKSYNKRKSTLDNLKIINDRYKEQGMKPEDTLIETQRRMEAAYGKDMQQVVSELLSLPPCDTPNCTLHNTSNNSSVQLIPPLPTPTQAKRLPPQRKITKNSRSNSTSKLNFNIELSNKLKSLDNLTIQSQPIADTTNLPHHSNIATTKNTVKPTPNSVNLPPPTMLKITDDLRNQTKILTTKRPYLRNKKAGQYIKLYTRTLLNNTTHLTLS
ncbi:hypothetical protein TNCV_4265041 [Trichonephila clavipes]|nr:hypothetical protein TNCV_4265041 [Trichonephila clavipes]